ncbi:MAG: hypothetical protein ACOX2U_06545 [Limisphaerales bacterium]|jgi:hypothetical protein|nr:hypothetical protein [Verrucomicrobiota bacterium]
METSTPNNRMPKTTLWVKSKTSKQAERYQTKLSAFKAKEEEKTNLPFGFL